MCRTMLVLSPPRLFTVLAAMELEETQKFDTASNWKEGTLEVNRGCRDYLILGMVRAR